MSNVKEFTDENFDIELKNTTDPVIVDFFCSVVRPLPYTGPYYR